MRFLVFRARQVPFNEYPHFMPDVTRHYEVYMYAQLKGESDWIHLSNKLVYIQSDPAVKIQMALPPESK